MRCSSFVQARSGTGMSKLVPFRAGMCNVLQNWYVQTCSGTGMSKLVPFRTGMSILLSPLVKIKCPCMKMMMTQVAYGAIMLLPYRGLLSNSILHRQGPIRLCVIKSVLYRLRPIIVSVTIVCWIINLSCTYCTLLCFFSGWSCQVTKRRISNGILSFSVI